jgi:hypothetical protein
MMTTLRDGLCEWQDWDGACFMLGKCIGLFAPDASFHKVKWMFWTNNTTGCQLLAALLALSKEGGPLESDDEGPRFRWRKDQKTEGKKDDA